MTVEICRKLKLMVPTSEGVYHGIQALTKQASATFDGETVTNRAYNGGSGKNLWNLSQTYKPTVKVNGVVSGCVVSVGAGNDNAAVAAGVVNINGVAVTVSADSSNAISLPASGKYAIYCFSVAADGTTFTMTKGTDGDALDWTAYGGAGQMPLCPADNAVLAYITRYSNVAGALVAGDIYAGESANVAYDLDGVRGNVVLRTALPASYTGAVARPVYASWYSQDGDIMQALAETESAKLDVKITTYDTTPADRQWSRKESGRASWSASVSSWLNTDKWLIDKCLAPKTARAFIKAYVNDDSSDYYIGEVALTGFGLDLKHGDVKIPYTMEGSGELCRIAA